MDVSSTEGTSLSMKAYAQTNPKPAEASGQAAVVVIADPAVVEDSTVAAAAVVVLTAEAVAEEASTAAAVEVAETADQEPTTATEDLLMEIVTTVVLTTGITIETATAITTGIPIAISTATTIPETKTRIDSGTNPELFNSY